MAKATVKYMNKLVEMHGENLQRVRKSTLKHLKNAKEAKKRQGEAIIAGPGSRKIRRNMIKALPGYKNKHMAGTWENHQRKTYGLEKYEYLREAAKRPQHRSKKKIINFIRKFGQHVSDVFGGHRRVV